MKTRFAHRIGAAVKLILTGETPQAYSPLNVSVTINAPNFRQVSEFSLGRLTGDIEEATAVGVTNGIMDAETRGRC